MNQSNDKRERWIFIFLALSFLIYALFHTTAFFEELSIPSPVTLSMTTVALAFFCFAIFLSVGISLQEEGLFPPESQKWIVLFVLSILLMTAMGLYLGNSLFLFYPDFEGVVILFGSMLLGARPKNWEYLDKLMLLLLAYGLVMNIASLPMIKSIMREDTEGSVTNKLQVLIYPALFYIYLFKYRVRWLDKLIIMSTFVLFIIEQILFQKRLPSVRILFTLFLMTYIQNLTTNPNFGNFLRMVIKRALLIGIPVTAAIFIISSTVGLRIADSLKLYNERVTGKYGFVHNLVYDSRYYIGAVVVEDLITSKSFILGKGFGGYLLDPRLYWTVDTGEGQFNGTTQIEIGQTWPVWKGGLLFWISINALYISLAKRFRKYRNSQFSLTCWAFVLTQFIFLIGENIWTGPYQLFIILIGVSIGHLLGRNAEQEFNMGGRLTL